MSVKTALKSSFFIAFVLLFAACTGDQESLLTKKWKTTSLESSLEKLQKAQYQQLLDTMTDQNEMMEYFGTVDSFKKVIQADIKDQEEFRKVNMENSFMDFKENHIAYFISVDGIDSAKWSLEENELILDSEEFTGVSELTRFTINKLTKDDLQLQMINENDTSIISLKTAKN